MRVVRWTVSLVVAAVSDVHGHYHHLAALLQRSGVDARFDRSFGANHMVVADDIVDRGPEITRSLWWRCEAVAAACRLTRRTGTPCRGRS